ncbi:MAG: hypothetical protein H5T44_04790 [Thermoplasmatales archaeon]|nr:hypothetical protein [Thermoplasmatales archaeon]
MKKFAVIFIILLTILFPIVNAGFINSDIKMEMNELSPISVGEKIYRDLNITFSWGYGLLFPSSLEIFLEVETPEWLTVSLSENSFKLTPQGFYGGEINKSIKVEFFARKEVEGFVEYPFKIRAYTDGNLLLKGCKEEITMNVMQNFYDRGIGVEFPSKISIIKGETLYFTMNITNNCNSLIEINLKTENISKIKILHEKKFSVPPHTKKSLNVRVIANETGEEDGKIILIYYPSADKNITNYVEIPIKVVCSEKASNLWVLILTVTVIILILIYILWKKK